MRAQLLDMLAAGQRRSTLELHIRLGVSRQRVEPLLRQLQREELIEGGAGGWRRQVEVVPAPGGGWTLEGVEAARLYPTLQEALAARSPGRTAA